MADPHFIRLGISLSSIKDDSLLCIVDSSDCQSMSCHKLKKSWQPYNKCDLSGSSCVSMLSDQPFSEFHMEVASFVSIDSSEPLISVSKTAQEIIVDLIGHESSLSQPTMSPKKKLQLNDSSQSLLDVTNLGENLVMFDTPSSCNRVSANVSKGIVIKNTPNNYNNSPRTLAHQFRAEECQNKSPSKQGNVDFDITQSIITSKISRSDPRGILDVTIVTESVGEGFALERQQILCSTHDIPGSGKCDCGCDKCNVSQSSNNKYAHTTDNSEVNTALAKSSSTDFHPIANEDGVGLLESYEKLYRTALIQDSIITLHKKACNMPLRAEKVKDGIESLCQNSTTASLINSRTNGDATEIENSETANKYDLIAHREVNYVYPLRRVQIQVLSSQLRPVLCSDKVVQNNPCFKGKNSIHWTLPETVVEPQIHLNRAMELHLRPDGKRGQISNSSNGKNRKSMCPEGFQHAINPAVQLSQSEKRTVRQTMHSKSQPKKLLRIDSSVLKHTCTCRNMSEPHHLRSESTLKYNAAVEKPKSHNPSRWYRPIKARIRNSEKCNSRPLPTLSRPICELRKLESISTSVSSDSSQLSDTYGNNTNYSGSRFGCETSNSNFLIYKTASFQATSPQHSNTSPSLSSNSNAKSVNSQIVCEEYCAHLKVDPSKSSFHSRQNQELYLPRNCITRDSQRICDDQTTNPGSGSEFTQLYCSQSELSMPSGPSRSAAINCCYCCNIYNISPKPLLCQSRSVSSSLCTMSDAPIIKLMSSNSLSKIDKLSVKEKRLGLENMKVVRHHSYPMTISAICMRNASLKFEIIVENLNQVPSNLGGKESFVNTCSTHTEADKSTSPIGICCSTSAPVSINNTSVEATLSPKPCEAQYFCNELAKTYDVPIPGPAGFKELSKSLFALLHNTRCQCPTTAKEVCIVPQQTTGTGSVHINSLEIQVRQCCSFTHKELAKICSAHSFGVGSEPCLDDAPLTAAAQRVKLDEADLTVDSLHSNNSVSVRTKLIDKCNVTKLKNVMYNVTQPNDSVFDGTKPKDRICYQTTPEDSNCFNNDELIVLKQSGNDTRTCDLADQKESEAIPKKANKKYRRDKTLSTHIKKRLRLLCANMCFGKNDDYDEEVFQYVVVAKIKSLPETSLEKKICGDCSDNVTETSKVHSNPNELSQKDENENLENFVCSKPSEEAMAEPNRENSALLSQKTTICQISLNNTTDITCRQLLKNVMEPCRSKTEAPIKSQFYCNSESMPINNGIAPESATTYPRSEVLGIPIPYGILNPSCLKLSCTKVNPQAKKKKKTAVQIATESCCAVGAPQTCRSRTAIIQTQKCTSPRNLFRVFHTSEPLVMPVHNYTNSGFISYKNAPILKCVKPCDRLKNLYQIKQRTILLPTVVKISRKAKKFATLRKCSKNPSCPFKDTRTESCKTTSKGAVCCCSRKVSLTDHCQPRLAPSRFCEHLSSSNYKAKENLHSRLTRWRHKTQYWDPCRGLYNSKIQLMLPQATSCYSCTMIKSKKSDFKHRFANCSSRNHSLPSKNSIVKACSTNCPQCTDSLPNQYDTVSVCHTPCPVCIDLLPYENGTVKDSTTFTPLSKHPHLAKKITMDTNTFEGYFFGNYLQSNENHIVEDQSHSNHPLPNDYYTADENPLPINLQPNDNCTVQDYPRSKHPLPIENNTDQDHPLNNHQQPNTIGIAQDYLLSSQSLPIKIDTAQDCVLRYHSKVTNNSIVEVNALSNDQHVNEIHKIKQDVLINNIHSSTNHTAQECTCFYLRQKKKKAGAQDCFLRGHTRPYKKKTLQLKYADIGCPLPSLPNKNDTAQDSPLSKYQQAYSTDTAQASPFTNQSQPNKNYTTLGYTLTNEPQPNSTDTAQDGPLTNHSQPNKNDTTRDYALSNHLQPNTTYTAQGSLLTNHLQPKKNDATLGDTLNNQPQANTNTTAQDSPLSNNPQPNTTDTAQGSPLTNDSQSNKDDATLVGTLNNEPQSNTNTTAQDSSLRKQPQPNKNYTNKKKVAQNCPVNDHPKPKKKDVVGCPLYSQLEENDSTHYCPLCGHLHPNQKKVAQNCPVYDHLEPRKRYAVGCPLYSLLNENDGTHYCPLCGHLHPNQEKVVPICPVYHPEQMKKYVFNDPLYSPLSITDTAQESPLSNHPPPNTTDTAQGSPLTSHSQPNKNDDTLSDTLNNEPQANTNTTAQESSLSNQPQPNKNDTLGDTHRGHPQPNKTKVAQNCPVNDHPKKKEKRNQTKPKKKDDVGCPLYSQRKENDSTHDCPLCGLLHANPKKVAQNCPVYDHLYSLPNKTDTAQDSPLSNHPPPNTADTAQRSPLTSHSQPNKNDATLSDTLNNEPQANTNTTAQGSCLSNQPQPNKNDTLLGYTRIEHQEPNPNDTAQDSSLSNHPQPNKKDTIQYCPFCRHPQTKKKKVTENHPVYDHPKQKKKDVAVGCPLYPLPNKKDTTQYCPLCAHSLPKKKKTAQNCPIGTHPLQKKKYGSLDCPLCGYPLPNKKKAAQKCPVYDHLQPPKENVPVKCPLYSLPIKNHTPQDNPLNNHPQPNKNYTAQDCPICSGNKKKAAQNCSINEDTADGCTLYPPPNKSSQVLISPRKHRKHKKQIVKCQICCRPIDSSPPNEEEFYCFSILNPDISDCSSTTRSFDANTNHTDNKLNLRDQTTVVSYVDLINEYNDGLNNNQLSQRSLLQPYICCRCRNLSLPSLSSVISVEQPSMCQLCVPLSCSLDWVQGSNTEGCDCTRSIQADTKRQAANSGVSLCIVNQRQHVVGLSLCSLQSASSLADESSNPRLGSHQTSSSLAGLSSNPRSGSLQCASSLAELSSNPPLGSLQCSSSLAELSSNPPLGSLQCSSSLAELSSNPPLGKRVIEFKKIFPVNNLEAVRLPCQFSLLNRERVKEEGLVR